MASSKPVDDASWQRSSIRIRRLPSNNAITRARAATVTGGGRPRASTVAEGGGGGQSPSPATGLGLPPALRNSGGYFTEEAPSSSTTRPRSGSGNNNSGRRDDTQDAATDGGRRRSSSDPTRSHLGALDGTHATGLRNAPTLPPVLENAAATNTPTRPPLSVLPSDPAAKDEEQGGGYFGRRLSSAWQTSTRFLPTLKSSKTTQVTPEDAYETEMVNILDTIGKCGQAFDDPRLGLTYHRSRGFDPQHSHERTKLPFCAGPGQVLESQAHI